jgi:hypothetical protein
MGFALGGESNQAIRNEFAAKKEAKNVGKNVVCHHQECRQDEPNQTFLQVTDGKINHNDGYQQGQVAPRKLAELVFVVTFLQGAHKGEQTCKRSEQHTTRKNNVSETDGC